MHNQILQSTNTANFFNSFLKNHIIFFLIKLKNLQKFDILNININDPFSFIFNRREMAKEQRILLKDYFIKQLLYNDILAVKTNLAFYDIFIEANNIRHVDYLLLL